MTRPKEIYLSSCPFCGATPEATRWHAGPRQVLIHCVNNACDVSPSVSGMSGFAQAAKRWNERFLVSVSPVALVRDPWTSKENRIANEAPHD